MQKLLKVSQLCPIESAKVTKGNCSQHLRRMSKQKLIPAGHLELPAMRSDYNQHSRMQSQSLQTFKLFIDYAVAAHSSSGVDGGGLSGAFVVADFGCSTGLNSSDAVSHVVGEVRKKYAGERCSSVLVVLNDLPRNDWCELFQFLHGDERSFLRQHRGVFAVSSGNACQSQVLPDNSLQIGLSNFSLHWCSQIPVKVANHCFAMSASEKERELFRQQAAKDWSNFLTARSKELVSGGVLALNVVLNHQAGDCMIGEVDRAAKSLEARGIIDSEELGNFNFAMYYRSLEDVTDSSQYESLGLELMKAEVVPPGRLVHYEDFLQHGDVGRFAEEFSRTCGAVCEPTFLGALSPSRPEEDKRRVCEELWRQFRAGVARNPEQFGVSLGLVYLVVCKK